MILEKYLKGEVKRDWLVNYVLNFVPKEDNSQASASVNE